MDSSWPMTTIYKLLLLEDVNGSGDPGTNSARPGSSSKIIIRKAEANRLKYNGVCSSLSNERWRSRWQEMCTDSSSNTATGVVNPRASLAFNPEEEKVAEQWRLNPCFKIGELVMTSLDEAQNVITMAADWLELDSADEWVRHDSEIALKQELSYASHLNIQEVILPAPKNREHVASYGRAIRNALESVHFMRLNVRIPVCDLTNVVLSPAVVPPVDVFGTPPVPGSPTIHVTPTGSSPERRRDSARLASLSSAIGQWELWDTIRTICDYNARLGIILDLTMPLPPDPQLLNRWAAEPVRQVFLPASTFISNAKGYPVLPKATQAFLQTLMKNYPTIILSQADQKLHPRGAEEKYIEYLRYLESNSLHNKRAMEENTIEYYSRGYQDYLQAPLQPLQDHLASTVYENFERDPVKYSKYEEAIYQAACDRPAGERLVLCVAGAGRGPLIARALSALDRAARPGFVYAVEKNPNAIIALQQRQVTEWGDKVQILQGDMRRVSLPEKIDILISELLGSFGDNELSPECLDGAMRFLKEDGISIPSSYTAYLTPLSTYKLYTEAAGTKEGKERDKSMETLYVVMLQSVNILSGEGGGMSGQCGSRIQECWEFQHPDRSVSRDANGLPFTNTHNTRSTTLKFHIPYAGTLHGFGGYFEAVLYGNIGLSIHPERMHRISKDMLSWFPCFFPLKEPLYLPSNSELHLHIWRLTDANKVWYEWFAESFLFTTAASAAPQSSVVSQQGASRRDSSGSTFLIPASPISATASPMMDADLSFGYTNSPQVAAEDKGLSEGLSALLHVKLGHTSLHNPGGRSSWYGL